MFFESHPLRYSLTPYQVFTIWNVFYHPYLHIYPPTQNTVPHICSRGEYLHNLTKCIHPSYKPRVEVSLGDWTPHRARGL